MSMCGSSKNYNVHEVMVHNAIYLCILHREAEDAELDGCKIQHHTNKRSEPITGGGRCIFEGK